MAPNQDGAADQQGAASQQPKLGSLDAVETVVNEYAKKFAKSYNVHEDQFRVHLVTKFKGIMGLRRGPVVQIFLLWPDAQPNINTLLRRAFETIRKNKLVDCLAVEPVIHIKRQAEERKKWFRERLGDEADVILDLIPRHRLKVTRTVITTIEDTVTGEKFTVTHESKPEPFRAVDVRYWLAISRQVRTNHPEEETRYADEPDAQLPELEQARRDLADATGCEAHDDQFGAAD